MRACAFDFLFPTHQKGTSTIIYSVLFFNGTQEKSNLSYISIGESSLSFVNQMHVRTVPEIVRNVGNGPVVI